MRLHKLLALLIIVILSAGMLAGCGNTVKKDDLSEEVTLTYYAMIDPSQKVEDLKVVEDKINEYLKPKINAKIQIKLISVTEYNDKMMTMLTAGEPVDILFTNFWACEFSRAVSKNLFQKTDDLLNQYGADLKKQIDPDLLEGAVVNGSLYSVPMNNSYVYQQAYSFNKKLVAQNHVDLTTIKSFKDLETALEKVHRISPDLQGLALVSEYLPVDDYDFPNGSGFPGAVKFDDPDCKVVNQFEQPQFKEIFNIYREMFQHGLVSKDAAQSPSEKAVEKGNNALKTGKALCGIFINGPTLNAYLNEMTKNTIEFTSIPANRYPVKNTKAATSFMLAIPTSSQHPERAMMFLNLLGTDPYLANLCAYGIEGVHYKKISATHIEWLPRHETGFPIYRAVGVNNYILYTVPGEPDNFWEVVKKYNNEGKKSPLYGFNFNSEPVKTEVASLANICREYDYLWRGTTEVEPALKAWNDKLKAAGLDKVLTEMQKQINEWKKIKK